MECTRPHLDDPHIIDHLVDAALDGAHQVMMARLRWASWDVAGAADWNGIANRKPDSEYAARRAALLADKSDTRPTDTAALEAWVRIGEAP